jgi:ElaB/YqjD/DUF883 family membrane-anchored ribosome-binding protein
MPAGRFQQCPENKRRLPGTKGGRRAFYRAQRISTQEGDMSDWSQESGAAAKKAENGASRGADAVRSTARGAVQAVNDVASQAYSRSGDAVKAGADQVSATASMLAEQIRSQPVAAAVTCLGLGFIVGMMLTRRR